MRVLITGAAGFIGSALSLACARSGMDVVALDSINTVLNGPNQRHARIERFQSEKRIEFILGDLLSIHLDHVLADVEAVVHLAAVPGLAPSWTSFDEYMRNNVYGTFVLADAVTRSSVQRAVYGSTSSVYGKYATGNETSRLDPASPYGISKLAAEMTWRAILDDSAWPGTSAILRYFSVYGPDQREDMAISRFINALATNQAITISGHGDQTRTYTYIDDVVSATVSTLQNPVVGTFNIAGDDQVNVIELVSLLEELTGFSANIEWIPARRGDQQEVKGDTSLAQSILGFRNRVGLADGLRAQIAASPGVQRPSPTSNTFGQ